MCNTLHSLPFISMSACMWFQGLCRCVCASQLCQRDALCMCPGQCNGSMDPPPLWATSSQLCKPAACMRLAVLHRDPHPPPCLNLLILALLSDSLRMWFDILGDLKITSTGTEGQKRSKHLAPVLVIISGNSLVFSRKIITSTGFTGAAPPARQHQCGKKSVSHIRIALSHVRPISAFFLPGSCLSLCNEA